MMYTNNTFKLHVFNIKLMQVYNNASHYFKGEASENQNKW